MLISKETNFSLKVFKNILEGFQKKIFDSLFRCFGLGFI